MPQFSSGFVYELGLLPPDELLTPLGSDDEVIAARRIGIQDDIQRAAFEWCLCFQTYFEQEAYARRYAGFQFATFGFVPLIDDHAFGGRSVGGYVFGAAIEIQSSSETTGQTIESFDLQGLSFPLIINRRRIELQSLAHPVYPSGTGACWAESKRAMLPGVLSSEGVLTAEHVISGTPLGGYVVMTSGGSWQLADRGDCKIDAALVTQPSALPATRSPLIVETLPVPGTPIEILGNASLVPITGSITHTMICPSYLSELNPMRVFLDVHGISGDSGALVIETASKKGVGIYMGQTSSTIAAPGGGLIEGVCQYLEQARAALNLDLFR